MIFEITEKDLEKLIGKIDKLISKMIRFNIVNPCALYFCFNRVNTEIFPVLSHIQNNKLSFKDMMKDNDLIGDDKENEITNDDVVKFMEDEDPLAIIHNVVLSSEEIDLSLERSDKFLFSKPINVFILKKFKEFLSFKLVNKIVFQYDEILNHFSIKEIVIFDEENPITKRQMKIYLNMDKFDTNFMDYDRNRWINADIQRLCSIINNTENKATFKIPKEDNSLDEMIFNVNGTDIKVSKEFLKADIKNLDIVFDKYLTLDDLEVIIVLLHVQYSNNHQYVFYKYYNF